MVTRTPRILVKAAPMQPGTAFSIGKTPFTLQLLFPESHRAAIGLAATPQWHITEAPEAGDEADLWDICHRLVTKGFGVAGGPPAQYAEPDFEQQWPFDSPDRLAAKSFAAAAGQTCKAPDPPDTRFPKPSPFDWRWYQDTNHSGLAQARSEINSPANRITIAHLDTGYRKGHAILPQFLDANRQRSFVDGDPDPDDASDPFVQGLGDNPGHGTGTISILAGKTFNGAPFGVPTDVVGGAPFATVIPVRVANSVVLFSNSSIAKGIRYAIDQGVDVLSMSMGGVPAQVWADVVNDAYDAGITLVTAAGNNFGPGKFRVPRFIVYPARFHRVLAACGVMSDLTAYADFLDPRKMAGSYGPDSKMDTAMAAYTPNAAWAEYACTSLIAFDGAGTSSATPQIAAAAACWLQKNQEAVRQYTQKWMRVEAVRFALFEHANNLGREHFGRGAVRAGLSMGEAAPAEAQLKDKMQPKDSIDVPFLGPTLGVIFGAAAPPSQAMLRVEAAQILARSGELQNILVSAGIDPDRPATDLPAGVRQQFLRALAEHSTASKTLKQAVGGALVQERPMIAAPGVSANPTAAENPPIMTPRTRRLQVFAFDPILGLRIDTENINATTLEVPWEADLQPGPVGEYVEIVDVDPASGACYAPVDLNHPYLLANDGLDPAEGVPQFHQQMVYAVAMTTIGRFEEALGRKALWAPYMLARTNGDFHSYYVQRLRIYPHALREQNAYYSPQKKSVLFGYFRATEEDAGDNLPGGLVFCCLSHDVVAHETTHALLDGLHRYYQYQTNDDMAAFHEAFADIVALFQHFTIPAALKHTIAKSRGDLKKDNLLAQLAQQFGQASSGSAALRSALREPAKSTDYKSATEPHAKGAVLLSAVFQAFLEIYDARIAVLKRIATGGTGVLPPGEISADLVDRMAREASIAADHVLRTCIRALDYCPPVDITFGDYLRALITADMDIEPEDEFNYRTAFISGFRARGIFPEGVRNISEENLRWQPPKVSFGPEKLRSMMNSLDLTWNLSSSRRQAYQRSETNGYKLWQWLQSNIADGEAEALETDLGVYIRPGDHVPKEIPTKDGLPVLQIHSVRPARRINSRGQQLTDLVVEAIQRFVVADPATGNKTTYRGGFTLLIDMEQERFRYAIRKRVGSAARIRAQQGFMQMAAEGSQSYFDPSQIKEPFAMMHRGE
jgi:hypothetical protein